MRATHSSAEKGCEAHCQHLFTYRKIMQRRRPSNGQNTAMLLGHYIVTIPQTLQCHQSLFSSWSPTSSLATHPIPAPFHIAKPTTYSPFTTSPSHARSNPSPQNTTRPIIALSNAIRFAGFGACGATVVVVAPAPKPFEVAMTHCQYSPQKVKRKHDQETKGNR